MNDHVRDLESARDATGRLLTALLERDDAATALCLLPDRPRGHLRARLSRSADALVNALTGQFTCRSPTALEGDLGRDAARSPTLRIADLGEGATRFQDASARSAARSRTVLLCRGGTDLAARVAFRCLGEVALPPVRSAGGGLPPPGKPPSVGRCRRPAPSAAHRTAPSVGCGA